MTSRPLPQPTANSPLHRLSSFQNKKSSLTESVSKSQNFGSTPSMPASIYNNITSHQHLSGPLGSRPNTPATPKPTNLNTETENRLEKEYHKSDSSMNLSKKYSKDDFSHSASTNTPVFQANLARETDSFSMASLSQSHKINNSETDITQQSQKPEQRPNFHVKIVCVGDGGCGKTSLLLTYTIGKFPTTYVPTVFENYLANIKTSNDQIVELALWDTAGQEEYDRLRVLSYPEVNILLICFSIDSPNSLENVVDKWLPEVSHFCPGIPFLLVALKTDLRTELGNKNIQFITKEQGMSVSKNIGAKGYLECSARMSRGVSEVFTTAINIVLHDYFDSSVILNENEQGFDKALNSALKPEKLYKNRNIKINDSLSQTPKKKKKHKCIIL